MITIPGAIPIRIHPFFWLLAALIGWLNSNTILGTAIWIGVIFVSVLIHEYGHALTAAFFGQKTEISLVAFGGLTSRTGKQLKGWQDFLIVLNGPLAGFMLAIVSYILLPYVPEGLPHATLQIMVYANVFWTILNLLPVIPLDGGHLLRILMQGLFGITGVKIALFFSTVFAGLLALFFVLQQQLFAAAIFMIFTFESFRAWNSNRFATKEDQSVELREMLQNAEQSYLQGNPTAAISLLEQVRAKVKKGILFVQASEYYAKILMERGDIQQAYEVLNPIKNQLDHSGTALLHILAFKTEHWREAIALGNQMHQAEPDAEIALINAFSHAQLKEVTPAIGWLRRAIAEGAASSSISSHYFDPIRNDPHFKI